MMGVAEENVIDLDASRYSGSGTILRTGLAIAALTGEKIRFRNLRQSREPPGLRAQHARVVEAVAQMTRAELQGGQVGSKQVGFQSRCPPRGGEYEWEIGTAGSTTLLAQAVMPLALFASKDCQIQLGGGVFQDHAPTAFHLEFCLLPLLARMGMRAHLNLVRPGYTPRGGGILRLDVQPRQDPLRPLELDLPVGSLEIWGLALSSHLEKSQVSDRLAETCRFILKKSGWEARIRVLYDHTAHQPGAALSLIAESPSGAVLGADMVGAPGRRSEKIGQRVAQQLVADVARGATVDRFLGDQLVLYAALADGTSCFRVPRVTPHLETNAWLARELLGARVKIHQRRVQIEGIGYHRPS